MRRRERSSGAGRAPDPRVRVPPVVCWRSCPHVGQDHHSLCLELAPIEVGLIVWLRFGWSSAARCGWVPANERAMLTCLLDSASWWFRHASRWAWSCWPQVPGRDQPPAKCGVFFPAARSAALGCWAGPQRCSAAITGSGRTVVDRSDYPLAHPSRQSKKRGSGAGSLGGSSLLSTS